MALLLRLQLSKSNDAIFPVTFECRVRDAFARRGVIKAILVGDDAHMAKAVKEDQRAKFVSLVTLDRLRLRPQAACTGTCKVDPCFLKCAPDKT